MPLRLLLLFLAFSMAALADQVTLKNGDRISGVVLKSDLKELTLRSEFAGIIKIQWDAVELLNVSAPIYVHLSTGDTLFGPIASTDGQMRVATTNMGVVAVTKEKVKALISKEEEVAYERDVERLRNPGLLDLWTGFVDTGLSMARGNSNTTTFTVGMNATRVTPRDKITTYFTSVYSKNKTNGLSVVGAQADRGGIRYDANFAGRNFAFGSIDLEYDKLQDLDLRSVFGGGVGRHVIRNDNTIFDVFAGGTLNKEFFANNLNRTSGEIQLGDLLKHRVNRSVQLTQTLLFFPNLSETGEFRMNFDLAVVATLKRWLGWHVTFSDRYLSNPVLRTIKNNDVLLTTGLRVTFAK